MGWLLKRRRFVLSTEPLAVAQEGFRNQAERIPTVAVLAAGDLALRRQSLAVGLAEVQLQEPMVRQGRFVRLATVTVVVVAAAHSMRTAAQVAKDTSAPAAAVVVASKSAPRRLAQLAQAALAAMAMSSSSQSKENQ